VGYFIQTHDLHCYLETFPPTSQSSIALEIYTVTYF
jgi:hypothetical protein